MEKRISVRELAAIKRIAMNVNPLVVKKQKAKAMIDKWTKEHDTLEASIKGYESGITAQLGVRTEQVVSKVVENTGKLDKNGKEIKQTKYVINDNVRFDQEAGEYIVTIADENDNESAPVAEVAQETEHTDVEPEVTEPETEAANEVADGVQEKVFEESFGF